MYPVQLLEDAYTALVGLKYGFVLQSSDQLVLVVRKPMMAGFRFLEQDGFADRHSKEIGAKLPYPICRQQQQLLMMKLKKKRAEFGPVLRRSAHSLGKGRPIQAVAVRADFDPGSVLGYFELGFRKLEHLSPLEVNMRLVLQGTTAGTTVDRNGYFEIRLFDSFEGVSGMSRLSARLSSGFFSKTSGFGFALFKPVRGWRFAAVLAVFTELGFQIGDYPG